LGTAGAEDYVNVSSKGMDSFRILDDSIVAWLNLAGSGNETAAHVLENRRMTVRFCSLDKQPLIIRLYGQATAVHPREGRWDELSALFPFYTGARQFFSLNIELVQTPCGYGVPYFRLEGERPTLAKWADNRGGQGTKDYWMRNNAKSLNNADTGI
jgi:hypothetical protein